MENVQQQLLRSTSNFDCASRHGTVRLASTPGRPPLLHVTFSHKTNSMLSQPPQQRASASRHLQPIMSKTRFHASVGSTVAPDADSSFKPSSDSLASRKPHLHDVVIVGGGIAGLATALALYRLGVKSVVLEQSERLRTAGSTIGVWSNAWKALEALGVADGLREKFIKLSGFEFFEADGSLILSLGFDQGSREVELRGVERKTLLETLRKPLPDGSIFYDSQVVGIRELAGGYTEVECENGQTIQSKILIGCDGVRSVVANWMNMKEPRFAGYTAIRGLAEYPDGHKFTDRAKQILGRGVRAGVVPMDAKSVYWFVVFNSSGERITDVERVREEALNYVKGWTPMITEAINRSSLESLSRRAISDRWMWPVGGPPLYKGGVTLAGDAMHPMTPNLGQGGCCALEDAVILARAISKALSPKIPPMDGSHNRSQEGKRIEFALKSYVEARWPRILPMAIRSYATGAFLQLDSDLVCLARKKLIPKVVKVDTFLDHTFYDCGTL